VGPSSGLGIWITVWALVAGVILVIRGMSRRPGSGLVEAYLFNLALLHWLGGALYLLPWYTNHDPDVVAAGLQQSLWAVIGFGVGSVLLAPVVRPALGGLVARTPTRLTEPWLARRYIQVGLITFFALTPIIGRIPTVSAIVVQGWNLLVVGLGLTCWHVWRERKPPAVLGRWLAVTLCLPLVTIITQGFIGYGIAAATAIFAFIGNFYRPRWRVLVAAVILGYLGLSMYVTYMRDREAIREVVWSGQPIMARVERLQMTIGSAELFDPHNRDHLVRIDDRLNQNLLLGAAVYHIDAGLARFAYGQTLWQGFIAVIPRAVWPTKPVVAGSGTLVTQYTGISFAEGTAVGIGHVMEAYISFGAVGVLVGFVLVGAIVGVVDGVAGQRLWKGDARGFVRWFLPGLSLLQVGGSIVELTSSVAAAMVASFLLNRLLRPSRQPVITQPPVLVARRI
jgi:hypothetical protein